MDPLARDDAHRERDEERAARGGQHAGMDGHAARGPRARPARGDDREQLQPRIRRHERARGRRARRPRADHDPRAGGAEHAEQREDDREEDARARLDLFVARAVARAAPVRERREERRQHDERRARSHERVRRALGALDVVGREPRGDDETRAWR